MTRLSLLLALIIAVCAPVDVLFSQDSVSPENEAAPTDLPVQADSPLTPGNRPKSALNFPRYELFEEDGQINKIRLPQDHYRLPRDLSPAKWPFSLAKIAILMTGLFLWVRAIRVCHEDTALSDADSGWWLQRLFFTGFFGLLAALFFPDYIIAPFILLATTVVPYILFMRRRNRVVTAPTSPLTWSHFFGFGTKRKVRRPEHVAEMELAGGEKIGSANAEITFIAKTSTGATTSIERTRTARSSPAFQMALALIDHVVKTNATDLHINTKDDQVIIRERVDSTLRPVGVLSLDVGRAVINVFKVLCDLSIADHRRAQDGSFRADVNGRRLSFRVASQGTQTGEKLSIRILDPAKSFSTLSAIGMPRVMSDRLEIALNRPNGLILFVGSTGAGKSTTACAALQSLDPEEKNVVSIEDPIEYQMPNVDQIEINYRAGQTFPGALRAVLRQDADAIFIGEIRDEETARIACQAANAGQLVVATIHANDAASVIVRLSELGIDPAEVANALRVIIGQTLVRKLCTACRISYQPDEAERNRLGLGEFGGELFRRPESTASTCPSCNDRGFLGRTAVFELLDVTPSIREVIRSRSGSVTLAAKVREDGATTMRQEGLRLLREGIISPLEFGRVFEEES